MKTAADIVTAQFGEHYFTARQTNADLIRKRTADIMRAPEPILERTPDQADPDGVRRDWYNVKTIQEMQ